ncbi:glycosyltransferase [Nostoc sp. NZL]
MNPKVSVIIPACNTEAYIAKAIESTLEQTLKDIEVIMKPLSFRCA